jgi:hypothetical protein
VGEEGGGGEADETLLRLRGKSCVGQVLASSSLCACPESFFLFQIQMVFPAEPDSIVFYWNGGKKN